MKPKAIKHPKAASDTKNKPLDQLGDEDLVITEGTDTYVKKNNKVKTLALNKDKRASFFAKNPLLLAKLEEREENPLVEEGTIQQGKRERQGEHFITWNVLKILINELVLKYKDKENPTYNTNNIFLINNDQQELKHILQNLQLAENNDAKFIYIDKIHAIAFYLRNIDGKMNCFIVDSDYKFDVIPSYVLTPLRSIFKDINITVCTTPMQKDYYSCATFAYKSLLYFVKHGAEVFEHINGIKRSNKDQAVINKLSPEELMPKLFKMIQYQIKLSPQILNTVVSKKRGLTLAEYWKLHEATSNYNSAALRKKYKYFEVAAEHLRKMPKSSDNSSHNNKKSPKK